jgi:hypothetical protein
MPYVQNRVYLKDYASLPADSPLLAPIPTVAGKDQQYVHHLLAGPFHDMDAACFADLGIHLWVTSGRRDCLWDTFEDYKKDMIAQYGSLEKGQKFRAFQSPHQTGLCIDLLCGGLAPVSATIDKQKKTRLYAWLVANMWRWGFTPYFAEPWHIEYKVDPSAYWAGTEQAKPFELVTTCSEENDVCEAPHDWVTA